MIKVDDNNLHEVGLGRIAENVVIFSNFTSFFEGDVTSECYTIRIVINGEEKYQINNQYFNLKANEFVITNPSDQVRISFSGNPSYKVSGLCIYITSETILDVYSSLIDRDIFEISNVVKTPPKFLNNIYKTKTTKLGLYLNDIINNIRARGFDSQLSKDIIFTDLSSSLFNHGRFEKEKLNLLDNLKYQTRIEVFKRINLMHEYINDNYKSKISLNQLAQIACISKFHASRLYKKIHKVSPYDSVIKLRLKEGKRLLKEGKTVKNVSENLGFTDRKAFTKLFKKEYGLSPSEMKNNLRKS